MKKLLGLFVLAAMVAGCGDGGEMEQALKLRSAILASPEISFRCQVTADYIDRLEEFTLDCAAGGEGSVEFTVVEPESIRDIAGTVSGQEGKLVFADTVLAFPLLADDRFSPISAPWLLLNTLKQGCITACCREEELLRLTVDDSYADDALTMEIWCRDGVPIAAEIGWQGRRVLSMTVESWRWEA